MNIIDLYINRTSCASQRCNICTAFFAHIECFRCFFPESLFKVTPRNRTEDDVIRCSAKRIETFSYQDFHFLENINICVLLEISRLLSARNEPMLFDED